MYKLNDRTAGTEWLVGAALFLGLLFVPLMAKADPPRPPGGAPNPTDKASLYKCLDADFKDLLRGETDPQPLLRAEGLLAQTDQSAHWTNYMEATTLIRRQRSKAAIPLLLKYMVQHAGFSTSHVVIPAYSDALNLLVGQKIEIPDSEGPDRQAAMEKAILKLYVDWWLPNKQKLNTDLAKMTDEQIKFVVSELLRHSASEDQELSRKGAQSQRRDRPDTANGLFYILGNMYSGSGRPQWWKEELNGRMTDVILEKAGWHQGPPYNQDADRPEVNLPAVPLLAALRQMRKAPALDKIAADPKADGAARITCILAMHFAGEDIPYMVPLELLDADDRLEVRLLSLLAVGLYQRDQTPVYRVLKALDDNNAEVRVAALWAIRTLAPKAAAPKLLEIISNQDPPEMVRLATMTLGDIGGDKVAAALAATLEKYVNDGVGADYYSTLATTVIAFATATGHPAVMTLAGAHDKEFFMEQARQEIAWWKAHHR